MFFLFFCVLYHKNKKRPLITKENPKFIGGKEKSEKLNDIYEDIAIRNECEFMGNEDWEVISLQKFLQFLLDFYNTLFLAH